MSRRDDGKFRAWARRQTGGTRRPRCIYCGRLLKVGDGSYMSERACADHADLPGLEAL